MHTVKFNFTLDEDVAEFIRRIDKGQRSNYVNGVVRKYINEKQSKEIIEGFKQETEDFEALEQLGFETWK